MKNEKVWLLILVVVGFALNVYFFLQINNHKTRQAGLLGTIAKTKSEADAFRNLRLDEVKANYHHMGRVIRWDSLETLYKPEDSQYDELPDEYPGKRLLWVFTEVSCDVCRDRLTDFARDIATDLGSDAVLAVVHAAQRRYGNAYARMNQVNFPVYFSQDFAFMRQNELQCGPVILLLDENNRVLASHCPTSTNPVFTDHFFAYAKTQLGLTETHNHAYHETAGTQ